jgi:hypothetical protein
MGAIINFWNFLKTFLIVKLGHVSTVIDHRMRRRSTNIDESQFYSNGLNEDGESYHSEINKLSTIPKPGFYLSRTDAAVNGCLLGPIDMDMVDMPMHMDDGPGFYY